MRCLIEFLGVCLIAAGLASAESIAPLPSPSGQDRCAGEMTELHGVWQSRQAYLPLFGDLGLVAYLAALGRDAAAPGQPELAILPVFSSEPIHFRRRQVVFVSTGLVLGASSEQELIQAIRHDLRLRDRVAGKWRPPARLAIDSSPACAALSADAATGFSEIRQQLAVQVEAYEDLITPRLRRRP